jgi:hypothetical protein
VAVLTYEITYRGRSFGENHNAEAGGRFQVQWDSVHPSLLETRGDVVLRNNTIAVETIEPCADRGGIHHACVSQIKRLDRR